MDVSAEFNQVLSRIINAIPDILMAIALLLIAWIVATVVKKIITKGGKAAHIPRGFAKGRMAQSEVEGEELLEAIGKLAFYLVFLLVIPTVFATLGMTAISQPLSNMADNLLGYIPNILGAALILFIGWFIAKFIREIVTNILHGLGVDRLTEKYGLAEPKEESKTEPASKPETETKTGEHKDKSSAQKPITLSQVIGNIVYVLILIPVIIASLETLQIQTITEPAIHMLNLVFGYIPNVIAGVILIIIGVILARFVGRFLYSILEGSGIDGMVDRFNKEFKMINVPNFSLSKVVTEIVKILIVLFFVIEAMNVMELAILQTVGSAILLYIPFLLGAFITLLVGLILANFVEKFVHKYSGGSKALGKILKYLIIVFAIFMTLDQLQLASSIVNYGFIAMIAGLSVAFAIAFGLGGRTFASKQLEHLDTKLHSSDGKYSEQIKPQDTNDPDQPFV